MVKIVHDCGEKVNTCSNIKQMVQDAGMSKHLFKNHKDCSGLGKKCTFLKITEIVQDCREKVNTCSNIKEMVQDPGM